MGIARRFYLLLCAVAILPSIASGVAVNPEEYRGQPIAQIRFEPPEQPVAADQLRKILPLNPRTPLDPAKVRAAIKALYATGRFADVAIEAEPASAGGVTLLIRTVDQWFIGPVEVKGKIKLPPNSGQLANATRLEMGQPYEENSLRNAVNSIENLLKRNGLYHAKVDSNVTRDDLHQQVTLTFTVDSGKRARLEQPEITGQPGLPEEKVASAAKYKGWFRWKLATAENVQAGVRKVEQNYEKRDMLTASVSLKDREYDAANDRVKPKLEVNGGPKVSISAEGAKVSKGKLKKYVPVFDQGTVNRDLLVQGARNLRDYLQSNGYFDAAVDFRTEMQGADLQKIVYTINPGTRRKLVQVEIKGNHYFTTAVLRERMFLQPSGFLYLRHGRYSEGFAKSDEDAVTALYKANGFRDVQVSIRTIDNYQGKNGTVAAEVSINEGPQYFVEGFQLTGVKQLDAAGIGAQLASVPGQPFSESTVAFDRDYLLAAYQSAGFPDAAFDWKVSATAQPYRMNVEYIITEGERRFVRDLVISGMKTTRERLLRPLIKLKAEDPLSWTEMGQMQQGLYNLGVFEKVDMAIQNPQGGEPDKYVLYHLQEGPRYSVAVGAGAEFARFGGSQSSLNNPGGTTGFAPRGSFEVSRLNLWGLGHTLTLKTAYSTLDRRASLTYFAPRYRNVEGRNITVTALYDDESDVLTFSARRYEGAAQISQKISKATSALFRLSYKVANVNASTLKIEPLLIPVLSQPDHTAMISASLIQDRRDDPVNAHRGIYNTVDFGVSERAWGSTRSFVRFLGRNSYYHRAGARNVIASNTEFGWIGQFGIPAGVDPASAIPLPERFFGGGSTSLRSFPENQAGPRDPLTGFPLGGNALLFHATEFRFPFIGDNIDGVFFHDIGNVYSSLGKISFRFRQPSLTDFNYLTHAAGFGIRYRTPVGPIRIDLAYSINPPTFNGLKGNFTDLLFGTAPTVRQSVSHFQFFFSIGQAF
jgi:outer membrane protein assembly complex protein YaeT